MKAFYSMEPSQAQVTNKIDPELLKQWEIVQNELKRKIITENTESWQNDLRALKIVAGLDISYPVDAHDKETCDAFAAVVICEHPSLKVIYEEVQSVHLEVPYVPGFLAFKESTPLVNLLKEIIHKNPAFTPDVILVDGNGLLHPQRCGSACHIGYALSIPTIGVAKNLHILEGIECTKNIVQSMKNAGDYIPIRDADNCVIGMALKTAEKTKNPVYVSVGHKINLETAQRVVMSCTKFRVPEPLRFADHLSREAIRKLEENTLRTTNKKSKPIQKTETKTPTPTLFNSYNTIAIVIVSVVLSLLCNSKLLYDYHCHFLLLISQLHERVLSKCI